MEPADRVAALEQRVAELEARTEWLFRATGYGSANFSHPVGPPATGGGPAVSPAVLELVRQDKKIAAIKQFRQETGVGLAEAKNVIDSLG